MGYKIAFVSQKGGVSKSTLSRALGTTYAAAGWNVKIADLDINQSTSFTWLQRRLKNGVTPEVAVETFGTVASALKVADTYDLMIFDGAPHATKATAEVARLADLVVLPTALSVDDLEPTVRLANNLTSKEGVPVERIAIALSKVGKSKAQLQDARAYLSHTPYFVLDGQVPERDAFVLAQDKGLSIVETPFKGPKAQADELIQNIINRFETLVQSA
ncbi:ParA family protein (plasmid) [Halomonas qaidamensis]|uniref:ParA family protein n=1 Tax=Halomonas qaidamensis TaxID=2866211 RepID=A0ABY6JVU8_9GAMM|nr:ParA family protein [Halomonas qaidamensis]UYV20951.1 ParA family protein [Halomonas qaidamensis]